jgi:hypothetical protein
MLISRGHPVGSMHWGQLADHEAAVAVREEVEAWEQSQVQASVEDVESKPHVEVDSADQSDKIGTDDDSGESIESKQTVSKPKPGPGRPRKDYL